MKYVNASVMKIYVFLLMLFSGL